MQLYYNIKYDKYYKLDKKNMLIYDDNSKQISKTNILYRIMEKYNNMLYLDDIQIIPNKSMEEADNNLVYRGKDQKKKLQYCYGVEYVKKRKNKKLSSFIKVYKATHKIEEIINYGFQTKKKTKDFLLSTILLLEMTYFIRLGKEKYYNENGTVGILTLKKENIIKKTDDLIIIDFKGKTNKQQTFYCYSDVNSLLFKALDKLTKDKKDDEFIFVDIDGNKFTERILNGRLKKIGLTLKEFRTYGTNLIFLKNIYEFCGIKEYTEKEIKKIIQDSIEKTANTIGHTKNISKKSYLSEELQNNIIEIFNQPKIKNFNDFLLKILPLNEF